MIKAARKAGRSLVKDFREVENLQVSTKGPGDFVSKADREAERGAHERRRARRRQDGGQDAVEERAGGSLLRGQAAGGVHHPATQRDFENAEQVQRDQHHQHDEAQNE